MLVQAWHSTMAGALELHLGARAALPAPPAPRQVQQALLSSLRLPARGGVRCIARHMGCAATTADAGMAEPALADRPELRYGVGLEQGPREGMEDVTQVIQDGRCGYLFATVFDGHAGIEAAEYLHDNLYSILSGMLDAESLGLECSLEAREEGLCCPIELHSVLSQCYHRADEQLLQWLASKPGEEGEAGCTATTALLRPDRVIVANVGDSRAVLSRNGAAMDLSTEHRVHGEGPSVASETARVKAAGGWVDDGRVCGLLAVSRAFGDRDFKGEGLKRLLVRGVEEELWDEDFASKAAFSSDPVTVEPDVLEMSLSPGQDEFLVVATDGLWDVVTSQEAVTIARGELERGRHPKDAAERLARVAVRRATTDNVAVVIVDLLGQQAWRAANKAKASKKLFGVF